MSEKQLCFVIAPIGEPDSDTRKRSDQILKYVISPAVDVCGYQAVRADQISEPGIITSQVIQHIVDDPLVIADLTDRNPNVFYELAVRHVIRKPLVQIIRKGEPLPFDVAGTRTILIDHRDLESVEAAKKDIINQIKAVEKSALEIDTPISVALNLQLLKQSDNPEQRSLADMLAAMSEIRTSIASIEKKLSDSQLMRDSWLSDYTPHDPNRFIILNKPLDEPHVKLSQDQLDKLKDFISVWSEHNVFDAKKEQLRKLAGKSKTNKDTEKGPQ